MSADVLARDKYRSCEVGAMLAPSGSFNLQRTSADRYAVALGSRPGSGAPRRWPGDVVRWVLTADRLLRDSASRRFSRDKALILTVGARDPETKWIVIANGKALSFSSPDAVAEEVAHVGRVSRIVTVPELPT